jgi:hypothetical protein
MSLSLGDPLAGSPIFCAHWLRKIELPNVLVASLGLWKSERVWLRRLCSVVVLRLSADLALRGRELGDLSKPSSNVPGQVRASPFGTHHRSSGNHRAGRRVVSDLEILAPSGQNKTKRHPLAGWRRNFTTWFASPPRRAPWMLRSPCQFASRRTSGRRRRTKSGRTQLPGDWSVQHWFPSASPPTPLPAIRTA